MMIKLNWIFLSITCITLFACDKSNDEKKETKAALLTSSAWKFSAAGLDLNNDGTKDIDAPSGMLNTCETDNTVTFKSNNTGEMDEGPTKCDPADPQKVSFNWTLKDNDNTINVSTALFPGLDGDAKILELSSSKLTVSKSVSYGTTQLIVILFFTH